jgi:septal ring factor EnvC (AmiA/AmiB activator)
MFTFLDLIPKLFYAAAVAVLGVLLAICSWNSTQSKKAYDKLDKQFISYRLEAETNAAKARAAVKVLEDAATENERKTRDEQDRLRKINEAERASLRAATDGLRKQQDRLAASIAANAKSGNVAALAARATTAEQLFRSCSARYSNLGERAEKTRLQALGLHQYIRGNPSCARSFGSAVPEPDKAF